MSQTIRQKVDDLRERIEVAAAKSGRTGAEITLIGVTKGVPIESILTAIDAGITDVGENRVQEAQQKFDQLPSGVTRHMIGHLQTNKVRFVSDLFDMVHSVDRLRLARQLGQRLSHEGRHLNCLIQVNVAGEESKHGVAAEQALRLVEDVSQIKGITVRGLMTMAPFDANEKELRQIFGGLRDLAERVSQAQFPQVFMEHLSMGMSRDFEIAIEEGATMVRVGRAIFG